MMSSSRSESPSSSKSYVFLASSFSRGLRGLKRRSTSEAGISRPTMRRSGQKRSNGYFWPACSL